MEKLERKLRTLFNAILKLKNRWKIYTDITNFLSQQATKNYIYHQFLDGYNLAKL